MPNSTIFKNRINELIELREKDKVKTCKSIGVDTRSISLAMEYGILPSTKTLIKIADYFEVSLHYLLGKTEDNYFYPTSEQSSFPERLKILLKERDITAYKLANYCHFDKSYITKWNKGKITPSLEFLELISDFFDVSIDFLLGRTDDRK